MCRAVFALIFSSISVTAAYAQPVKSIETVTTTDGRKLTLNPDGTYSLENARGSAGMPVKVERWLFDHQVTKYNQKSVRFMPVVMNVGTKEIVGFKFTARFSNAFKEEVFTFNGTSEERLRPKATSTTKLFYNFEDNQFIPNETYDKLLPLVLGGTANVNVEITAVVFADGTLQSSK